jgi:molecular chaperone HtpG
LMPKTAIEEKAEDKPTEIEWETVNKATALWVLPKNQITAEEYNEQYKHIAHDFENPLMWSHNKVEGGSLDYISLLYIPAHAPYDLWNRDRKQGLKLYVQRVFIMDDVAQFMPNYLRFIRGIVDTTALPLNISREILQDNPTMVKLRSALVKRVLDMLEKLAKDEPEKYATFWKVFGNVLKEGPDEDFVNREKVAKLLRFTSTKTDLPEQNITLDEYISRMKPEQKKIYFITADTFTAAKASPQLEIFRKNGIEVLLCSDRIDEWLVTHIGEYEGKALQSVSKGDINLDDLVKETPEEKAQQKEAEEKAKQDFDGVIAEVKIILGTDVKDVRLSHRLTDSPACLIADDNDMGLQLQRLLKAAGQDVAEIKPIFELNPAHPLLLKLKAETNKERFKDLAQILFDQAVLSEGGQLKNPAEFVNKVNKLLLE